ncbi:hypothetical protein FB567DRAFT_540323 [Paraphoma chrysanthemicola]|uniref:Uncharacterized protein n=1 Tax=Paraphoma chrysanthemicola TaxID=798071 RepID=A0A8K0VRS6_9PLEO|nr:hypothetical protein FB567DRAFT_540323 [Paraphoma chrysanthemicola]
MPPVIPAPTTTTALAKLARRTLVTAAPALTSHHLQRRGLSVNHTQGVTLGVIAAYVVIIALLWNLPYVRWVLWPFKVRFSFSKPLAWHTLIWVAGQLTSVIDACYRVSRIWTRNNGVLHRRPCRVYIS